MLLRTHKKLLDEVDLQKLECEFVEGSETCQNYFGKFFSLVSGLWNIRMIDTQKIYFFLTAWF